MPDGMLVWSAGGCSIFEMASIVANGHYVYDEPLFKKSEERFIINLKYFRSNFLINYKKTPTKRQQIVDQWQLKSQFNEICAVCGQFCGRKFYGRIYINIDMILYIFRKKVYLGNIAIKLETSI